MDAWLLLAQVTAGCKLNTGLLHCLLVVQVRMPELALLRLDVWDKDVNSDDFVGHAIVPVPTIRPGYRSLRIYSSSGTVHGDFEHASLLCHFAIEERRA